MEITLFNRLFSLWKGFCRLVSAFVLTVLLVRFFETVMLWQYDVETSNLPAFNLVGFLFDLIIYFKIVPLLFAVYALIGWFKEKAARWTIDILHVILSIVSVALIIYFCSAHTPLDKVFVYYSRRELLHIIGASETTYFWAYLCLVLIPAVYLLILRLIRRIPDAVAVVCLLPLAAVYFISTPKADDYTNRNEFFIKKNKIEYFLDSFERNLSVSGIGDIIKEEKILYELYPDYKFVDPQYPFLYKDNAQDVLSPYFELGDKMPNIVVFIVEGLARENSGHNSRYVSATPYLDSLSDHALCWDNCYSTSPRTCHVLPSLLGSLPYGKSGFMSYGNNVPEFISLPKILKDNGYHFAYYYGGWIGFDDTDTFLNNNGVDVILEPMLYRTHEHRNTWGLFDDAMIDEAMKTMKAADKPRLDVFMTLTTHDPWEYPDAAKYQAKYREMGAPDKEFNPYFNPTAGYLYVDDCIRKVVGEYAKRDDFENTIFVFTGDHNFDEPDYLNTYKVPFVIWSPMLKKTAVFKPIVTHRDFTPSILAMLKNNYDFKAPKEVTWLSRGLDTVREFRANAIAPHIAFSRNICGMFCGDFLIQENNVYRLEYRNDDVQMVKDSGADSLKKYLKAYKILDRYIFENDALVRNEYNASNMTLLSDNVFDSVIECGNDEFPFVVMKVPLQQAYKFMKIDVSFDIFMNGDNDTPSNSPQVLISRKTKDGRVIDMSATSIDLYFIEGFNEWQNWSINEVIKQKKYKYESGDTLIVRFKNHDRQPFYLSNIKASLSVDNTNLYYENDEPVGSDEKIWAHRVNSPEVANQKIEYFPGIEVDLVFDTLTGELYVSHDIEGNNANLTFRQYLQQIKKPGRASYWLDVKNLYDNAEAICDTVIRLAGDFGFSDRFFVESWDVWALNTAKGKGVSTSLWVENVYDLPEIDTLKWVEKVRNAMTLCNPDALSAHYLMRPLLDEYIPEIGVNLWQTPAEFNDENVKITREICRDPHVKVLLVDYDKPISY